MHSLGGSKPTDLPVHAHQDHIEDRRWKVPVDALPLGYICDAMALRTDLMSQYLDTTTDPWDQFQNGFDQRAFSSSAAEEGK